MRSQSCSCKINGTKTSMLVQALTSKAEIMEKQKYFPVRVKCEKNWRSDLWMLKKRFEDFVI